MKRSSVFVLMLAVVVGIALTLSPTVQAQPYGIDSIVLISSDADHQTNKGSSSLGAGAAYTHDSTDSLWFKVDISEMYAAQSDTADLTITDRWYSQAGAIAVELDYYLAPDWDYPVGNLPAAASMTQIRNAYTTESTLGTTKIDNPNSYPCLWIVAKGESNNAGTDTVIDLIVTGRKAHEKAKMTAVWHLETDGNGTALPLDADWKKVPR